MQRFLELHPWSREPVSSAATALNYLWSFDLTIAIEELWPLVIDTSRFNRALGLSRMEFVERDGVLAGSGTNGGIRHEWVEVPWDWAAESFLVSRRVYSKGFARFVRVIYRLQSMPDGTTRFWVHFGWIPRGWFGRLMLKVGMPSMKRGYAKVLAEITGGIRPAVEPSPGYRGDPPVLAPEARQRIATLRTQLVDTGSSPHHIDKLITFVETADDMDAYRIQVRALARAWQLDEQELLRTSLHAIRAGLLQMSWDVICPHCRGVRTEAATLGDVPSRGACQVCDIDFETDSDNALEITFHVHPSIRDVPKLYFCSAEPSSKEHIAAQYALAPGESVQLDLLLAPGSYRARRKGEKRYQAVDVVADSDEATDATLEWRAGSHLASSDGEGSLRLSHQVELQLENDTEEPQTFVLERVEWADSALRPVDLFNLQEFRDLFSEEYLATDVQLSVGEQTLLFTDIIGSTRFYAERGDPSAFMEVKRHFVEIYQDVATHRGAVVKTIGDAAMASFSNPVDALEAALAIHRRFHPEREDTPIRVRISLNTGPCIAVKLNSNIDFFGTTVNVAAKLQACCEAYEIAMSGATHDAPGVADYLASVDAKLESIQFESKAIDEVINVFRWDTVAS